MEDLAITKWVTTTFEETLEKILEVLQIGG